MSGLFVTSDPVAKAVKPTTDPMDRSMLRVRITSVCAVAISAMMATEDEIRLNRRGLK